MKLTIIGNINEASFSVSPQVWVVGFTSFIEYLIFLKTLNVSLHMTIQSLNIGANRQVYVT